MYICASDGFRKNYIQKQDKKIRLSILVSSGALGLVKNKHALRISKIKLLEVNNHPPLPAHILIWWDKPKPYWYKIPKFA